MAYDVCIAYLKYLAACLQAQCPCTNDTDELHQNSMHSYRDTIVSIDGWWLIMIIIGVLLTH